MANVPPRPPHRRSKPALSASGFGISLHLGPWGSLHWSTEDGFQRETSEPRVRRWGVLAATRYMPPEAADQVVPAPPSPVHTYDGPETAPEAYLLAERLHDHPPGTVCGETCPQAGFARLYRAVSQPGAFEPWSPSRPLLPVSEPEMARWIEEGRDQLQPRPTDAAVEHAIRSLDP